jgi:hypothetical protein
MSTLSQGGRHRAIVQRVASIAQAWDEWSRTVDIANDPETDVDAEDMGVVLPQFARLRRLGVRFDVSFIRKMDAIKADAVGLDVDPDFDESDGELDLDDAADWEYDDPDDDRSDDWIVEANGDDDIEREEVGDGPDLDVANRDDVNDVARRDEQTSPRPSIDVEEFVVPDDSMVPAFNPGDRIFCDHSPCLDGDFVVVTVGDVRRLRQLRIGKPHHVRSTHYHGKLQPLNAEYPADTLYDVGAVPMLRVTDKAAAFKTLGRLRQELNACDVALEEAQTTESASVWFPDDVAAAAMHRATEQRRDWLAAEIERREQARRHVSRPTDGEKFTHPGKSIPLGTIRKGSSMLKRSRNRRPKIAR